jgi:hypothetical protein
MGAWSRVFATAFSGFTMFLDGTGNDLYVEAGYTSGNAMTGSMRIANMSFATMGNTMGSYVYTLASGDTFTAAFAPTPQVPTPATGGLA